MRKLAIIFLLLCSPAYAGNPGVIATGVITPGHIATFANNWTIQDGGASGLAPIGAYSILSNNTSGSASPIANQSLILGTPAISDTGVIGQLTSSVAGYNQFIIQNTSNNAAASTNYVVNNNLGTASTYYGEFGMNSSTFTGSGAFSAANAVYLDVSSGDLALGTLTSNAIHFVVNSGTTDAMTISSAGAVTIPAFNAAGVITNNSSGVLASSPTLPVAQLPAFTQAMTASVAMLSFNGL